MGCTRCTPAWRSTSAGDNRLIMLRAAYCFHYHYGSVENGGHGGCDHGRVWWRSPLATPCWVTSPPTLKLNMLKLHCQCQIIIFFDNVTIVNVHPTSIFHSEYWTSQLTLQDSSYSCLARADRASLFMELKFGILPIFIVKSFTVNITSMQHGRFSPYYPSL